MHNSSIILLKKPILYHIHSKRNPQCFHLAAIEKKVLSYRPYSKTVLTVHGSVTYYDCRSWHYSPTGGAWGALTELRPSNAYLRGGIGTLLYIQMVSFFAKHFSQAHDSRVRLSQSPRHLSGPFGFKAEHSATGTMLASRQRKCF